MGVLLILAGILVFIRDRLALAPVDDYNPMDAWTGLGEENIARVLDDVNRRIAELEGERDIESVDDLIELTDPPNAPDNALHLYKASFNATTEQEKMALLRGAVALEKYRYPADWREQLASYDWWVFPLDDTKVFPGFRETARFLRSRAIFAAASGNANQAVEAITLGLQMVRHLGQQPTHLTQMTRNVIQDLILEGLYETLVEIDLNDSQFASLNEAIDSTFDPERVARMEIGERVLYGDEGFQGDEVIALGEIASDMRLRVARVVLALERYRNETGEWAEAYDAFVPDYLDEARIDAFTGEPIIFRYEDGVYDFEIGLDDSVSPQPRDVTVDLAGSETNHIE